MARYCDEVVERLASSPRDAVLFALLSLQDVSYGWELAHSLALDDHHAWGELAKAHEMVDPLAVLPVLNRLVMCELVETGAQHYKIAARLLKKMRKLAAGSDDEVEVDRSSPSCARPTADVLGCNRSLIAPDFLDHPAAYRVLHSATMDRRRR